MDSPGTHPRPGEWRSRVAAWLPRNLELAERSEAETVANASQSSQHAEQELVVILLPEPS